MDRSRSQEEILDTYQIYEDLEYYNFKAGDDATVDNYQVCLALGKTNCSQESTRRNGNGEPTWSKFYDWQLGWADKFVEPQPIEQYLAGDTETPEISLGWIDRVPVTIL